MELSIFIQRLNALNPGLEYYKSFGNDEVWAKESCNFFLPKRIKAKTKYIDILLQFIECYEIDFVRFSNYSFSQEINFVKISGKRVYLIGYFDDNPLILQEELGEIFLYDYYKANLVLAKVAKNSNCFLEVLLILFKPFSLLEIGMNDEDFLLLKKKQINDCIEAAGGDEYKKFYTNWVFSIYEE